MTYHLNENNLYNIFQFDYRQFIWTKTWPDSSSADDTIDSDVMMQRLELHKNNSTWPIKRLYLYSIPLLRIYCR